MFTAKNTNVALAFVCVFFLFSNCSMGQFEVIPDEGSSEENNSEPFSPFASTPEDLDPNPAELTSPIVKPENQFVFPTSPVKNNPTTTKKETEAPPAKATTNGSGNATPASKSTVAPSAKSSFVERFWKYLKANNYKNWSAGPNQSNGYVTSPENAHGSMLKRYMNRPASGNPASLPVGSVIITENYDSDQKLESVSVMYRARNYSKKSKNWYSAEFTPDGDLIPQQSKKNAGVVDSCIKCHSKAAGDDMVFFNDQR